MLIFIAKLAYLILHGVTVNCDLEMGRWRGPASAYPDTMLEYFEAMTLCVHDCNDTKVMDWLGIIRSQCGRNNRVTSHIRYTPKS